MKATGKAKKNGECAAVDGFEIRSSDDVFQSPTMLADGIANKRYYIAFNGAAPAEVARMGDALARHLDGIGAVSRSGIVVEGMPGGRCRVCCVAKVRR